MLESRLFNRTSGSLCTLLHVAAMQDILLIMLDRFLSFCVMYTRFNLSADTTNLSIYMPVLVYFSVFFNIPVPIHFLMKVNNEIKMHLFIKDFILVLELWN